MGIGRNYLFSRKRRGSVFLQTASFTPMTHPFQEGDHVSAYLRDSGHEEQELSIPQQEKAVREFCAAEGLILVRIFKDESRPGSSAIGREAFQDMLAHFVRDKAPEAGLLLWSFARFARNDLDAQFHKAQLRRAGYEIHSLTDQVPEGLHGRLIEYVIDYSNALYLENLSKEVKRGLRELVEQYGGVPGTPPRGFRREKLEVGKRRDGQPHIVHRWVPRADDEWERCRLAWELRAKGATLAEIRRRTRLYKSNNSYHRFFRNRIYLGVLEFGPLTIPGYCEALISEETWNLVQDMNQRNTLTNNLADGQAANHPNRRRGSYLLSGLARCGLCGAGVNGNPNIICAAGPNAAKIAPAGASPASGWSRLSSKACWNTSSSPPRSPNCKPKPWPCTPSRNTPEQANWTHCGNGSDRKS